MHMPNFIIHQSRPEILPVQTLHGLHPYYYLPNEDNTVTDFNQLYPSPQPIGLITLKKTHLVKLTKCLITKIGPIEKSDTEIIGPEFVSGVENETPLHPTKTETEIENRDIEEIEDVEEVEIEKNPPIQTPITQQQSSRKDHIFKYFILNEMPQFQNLRPNTISNRFYMAQPFEAKKVIHVKHYRPIDNNSKNDHKMNSPNFVSEEYSTTSVPISSTNGGASFKQIHLYKPKKFRN